MQAGCLVLVVDDDEDIRESIADLLRAEGARVLTAVDGRDALTVLARARPSLMLIDLMMPVMDGWQLVDTLRRDPMLSMIPVCVMSAIPLGAPAGVSVLTKPLALDDLMRIIDQHC